MKRRDLMRGFIALGGCAAWCRAGRASEGVHWNTRANTGPSTGRAGQGQCLCSAGGQQSPINITSASRPRLIRSRVLEKDLGQDRQQRHTIQVNMPKVRRSAATARSTICCSSTSMPERASRRWDDPSDGMHFVHKNKKDAILPCGRIHDAEQKHDAFSMLARYFPPAEGTEGKVEAFTPSDLLPQGLEYWTYEVH